MGKEAKEAISRLLLLNWAPELEKLKNQFKKMRALRMAVERLLFLCDGQGGSCQDCFITVKEGK